MKRTTILLLFILPLQVLAQKHPDMGLYKVRITAPDKTITVEIKPVRSEPSIRSDRFYSWYSSNQIKQTQGGYSGTLLNGQYNEFYANKNLSEQGNYDEGLKDGVWKKWSDSGILMQLITWKGGVKQGEFDIYDEKGNLKNKGHYRNGVLDGKQIAYNANGTAEETIYKDGKLLPKKKPASFWKKINIFKKNRNDH